MKYFSIRLGQLKPHHANGAKTSLRAMMLLACMLLSVGSVWANTAQTSVFETQAAKIVSGVVSYASNGQAVVGATIYIKGTTKGTVSDMNGKYTLSAEKGDVLVFTFVGMESAEVVVGDKTTYSVKLKSSTTELDEVVAVGYGTTKKADITGSVASVDMSSLEGITITNADEMLKGYVAGVQVTQNSGAPGGASSIRIRGASSINSSNEPLYVIDGIPMSGEGGSIGGFSWSGGSGGQTTINPLAGISPNDIISMDVLKDASATAIYGAAGANGVIIIKTRRGEKGQLKVNYDGYYSIQQQAKKLDMMNLQEFAQYQNELSEFLGSAGSDENLADPSILGTGTDWQDEIFQTAPIQSHQLSLTGGSERTQFAVSGGYMDQDGIIFGSGFERYNARFNADAQINDWIKAGGMLAFTKTDEKITRQDGSDGVIMQAMTMQPTVPVYNFDGTWAGPETVNGSSQYNPVWMASMQNNTVARFKTMGNFYLELNPIKNLSFRSEYGYDFSNNQVKSFIPSYDFGLISTDINQMYQQEDHNNYWIWKNYATYNYNWNLHSVSMMGGTEFSRTDWEGIQLIKQGFTSDDIEVMTQDGTFVSNTGYKDAASSASFFGRLNYNYAERYILTATMRADGSSKFGPSSKWGYFPSAAFAWRVNNEQWLKNVDKISNLKLRLGYGLVGNSNIGTYKYGSAMYSINSPLGTAYRLENVSNPDLRWEASEQYNLGVDLGLFNQRVNLTVDVYEKRTKDLLMQVSIPSYLGDQSEYDGIAAPWVNIGQTENRGIDISLNTVNIEKPNFTWSSSVIFSHNKNKVVALNDDSQVIYGSLDWWSEFQTVSAIMVNQPMGVYYGYKVDRLFTDKEDILNSPVQYDNNADGVNDYGKATGIYPGDIKFQDINNGGEGDGKIDDNDQTVIGDPNPLFTFGFNNTFSYKNWDLTVGINGSVGGDILNFTRYKTEGMTSIWDNQAAAVIDRAKIGTDENGNTYLMNPESSVPRAATNDFNRNTRMSDRWIEDGTYVRIQNITLAYHIPNSVLSSIGVSSCKVYGTVQNLYTFTDYSGYDPEIGAFNQSALLQGIDMGRYPLPRTFTFGINLGF
ncbi:MAG: SusC/RagA family TonB-linked outer membrane protein [Mangrovibacterium sp.]